MKILLVRALDRWRDLLSEYQASESEVWLILTQKGGDGPGSAMSRGRFQLRGLAFASVRILSRASASPLCRFSSSLRSQKKPLIQPRRSEHDRSAVPGNTAN